MTRIGHAWDVHKLVKDRKLILGGVNVDSEVGLLGHSDADVVLHAVAESLLGSLALGDLGHHFSDTDAKNKDMNSKDILEYCYKLVLNEGWYLVNLDLTIFSEFIKISPIRDQIRQSIASILNVKIDQVSVKATTHEKMGYIGRGEAISCECVCLVGERPKKVLL